jgi:peptidoglycan/LPS O-acetylase OafA/YrhL
MEKSSLTLTAGFTARYLSFGGLVLLAGAYPDVGSRGPRVMVVPAKALAWIGVYSYTIYLSHSIVYCLPGVVSLRRLIAATAHISPTIAVWGNWFLFWGLAIGGGVLLARLVEQPFLKLRDRLYPSRGRNQDATLPRVSGHPDEGWTPSLRGIACRSEEHAVLAK